MPPKPHVFFGHDYFGGDDQLLRRYRRKLEAGCRAAGRSLGSSVRALYGNTRLDEDLIGRIHIVKGDINGIQDGRFWARIDGLIRISALGIFDLTLPGGPDNDVNWNTLMELGVARGARLPIRVIVKNRRSVLARLSNLDGTEIEECSDPQGLGMLVKELIIAFVRATPTP